MFLRRAVVVASGLAAIVAAMSCASHPGSTVVDSNHAQGNSRGAVAADQKKLFEIIDRELHKMGHGGASGAPELARRVFHIDLEEYSAWVPQPGYYSNLVITILGGPPSARVRRADNQEVDGQWVLDDLRRQGFQEVYYFKVEYDTQIAASWTEPAQICHTTSYGVHSGADFPIHIGSISPLDENGENTFSQYDCSPIPSEEPSETPSEEPSPSPSPSNSPEPPPRSSSSGNTAPHPWPDEPLPSFPPPSGPFALQVLPKYISTKGNSHTNQTSIRVTSGSENGPWDLSTDSGASLGRGTGGRTIIWDGHLVGRPLDDGRYELNLDAPTSRKHDSDDLIIDSTAPQLDSVTLTNIEDRVSENKSIYTFKVSAKDPLVNNSAAGLDIKSLCVARSNVSFEPVGTPIDLGDGTYELKVKFATAITSKHDFYIAVKDQAGNHASKECSLSFDIDLVGTTVEPELWAMEPTYNAYRAPEGPFDRGVLAIPRSTDVVKAKESANIKRADARDSMTNAFYRNEPGADSAAFGQAFVDYLNKQVLVPISLDDLNSPFFWTDGTTEHQYAIGLGVSFLAKGMEVQVPLFSVPAEVVFKHNPTKKAWLQETLVIRANNRLLNKAGKAFGLFGATTIKWDGRSRWNRNLLADGGRYSVHCNFGVNDPEEKFLPLGKRGGGIYYQGRVKYARLTGFGVINHHQNIQFSSFDEFKSFFGRAGDGYEWHHLVEQTTYAGKIPQHLLQSSRNIVRIHAKHHRKISGRYSRVSQATGLSLRDELKLRFPKPENAFDALRAEGIMHMRDRAVGDWDFNRQGTNYDPEKGVGIGQENDPEARSERN